MSNNKDSKLYNQTSIKIFKEYQIQLSIILDSINIEIQKKIHIIFMNLNLTLNIFINKNY